MSQITSVSDWKYYYFLGVSKDPSQTLSLSQTQVSSLLSLVDVKHGVSTGAAIDPRYLINDRGLTIWLAMYAILSVQYPKDLAAARKGEALLFLPDQFMTASFGSHNNWPEQLMAKYNFDLPDGHLFALPFVLPSEAPAPNALAQSLKSPDANFEMFGVYEFNETQPEQLLANYAGFVKWYRQERVTLLEG